AWTACGASLSAAQASAGGRPRSASRSSNSLPRKMKLCGLSWSCGRINGEKVEGVCSIQCLLARYPMIRESNFLVHIPPEHGSSRQEPARQNLSNFTAGHDMNASIAASLLQHFGVANQVAAP